MNKLVQVYLAVLAVCISNTLGHHMEMKHDNPYAHSYPISHHVPQEYPSHYYSYPEFAPVFDLCDPFHDPYCQFSIPHQEENHHHEPHYQAQPHHYYENVYEVDFCDQYYDPTCEIYSDEFGFQYFYVRF
jgi:hypothetical protein